MKLHILSILGCLISTQLWAAPAPRFQAGAATSNITPALGGGVSGGFVPFPATHVHDELHARCLVRDDGKTLLEMAAEARRTPGKPRTAGAGNQTQGECYAAAKH